MSEGGVSLTKGVSHVGETEPAENLLKPTVAAAAKSIPTLAIRENGVFRHPEDWTPEEDEVIAAGLRGMLPLYLIAQKVHCERHFLARHIEESPALKQLRADCTEARIDNAEYQADRLVNAGNPTMIMFTLERMGKRRGWSQQDEAEGQKDEGRIVMGLIPEAKVAEAEKTIQESNEAVTGSKVFESDPMKAAIEQQAAEDSQIGRKDLPEDVGGETSQQPITVVGDVSPAPYDDGMQQPDFAGGGMSDDPMVAFDDGGDSPFMN